MRGTGRGAGAGGDVAGLYGPGSVSWRLNREAMLLLGAGPRALLLQIAHPLVAEGVDQHSDFRADPWRRLRGTLRGYLTIVYGTAREARDEIARLDRLHRAVAGPVLDPAAAVRFPGRYSARDPALLLWVHATLVDSTIVAYREWIEPLGRDADARYYAETRPIGRAFGIPAELLPGDLDAFEAYVAALLAPDG
ncbi:MAG TPA: oxygenase MpaB family protein, partial [Candidatus Dormibacteraeota bacterium]|nr:oxygenase MpaB family protein [Candidatus Dormibacteraeota bacterium]